MTIRPILATLHFLTALFLFQIAGVSGFAQCPVTAFTLPDSICQGTPFSPGNLSASNTSSFWDFCTGDFNQPGYSISTFDFNSQLLTAAGAEAISDSSGDHLFICSRDNSKLLRVDFPLGFEQDSASVVDLGNLSGTIYSPNDISFVNESGIWFCLLADIYLNKVFRITFGNGLDQLPTVVDTIIDVPYLSYPRGIKAVRDPSGKVYCAVSNFNTNLLTFFTFGQSIANTPTLVDSFVVAGSAGLIDVDLIRDCSNWHAVCANYSSTELQLINLGPSLDSITHVTTTHSIGAGFSLSTRIVNDGGTFYAFTSNSNSNVYLTTIGSSLSNPTFSNTTIIPLGSGYISGISIFRRESDWLGFFPVIIDNTVKKIEFSSPCAANPPTSTIFSPDSISYHSYGTFYVTLCSTDSTGSSGYFTDSIQVKEQPVAGFSTQQRCVGLPADFSNEAILNSGSFISYHWDFGDGFTSNLENPSHTYADTGQFLVRFELTTSSGCQAFIDSNLSVAPRPVADFSISAGCTNIPVFVENLSSIGSGTISGYTWTFETGLIDTAFEPFHIFPAGGIYPVLLSVISDQGCIDTATRNATVLESPLGRFSVTNTCVGTPSQFIDLSSSSTSSISSRLWEFGDGDTSTAASPSHPYPPGTGDYNVRLLVNSSNGCSDTVEQTVRINEPPTVRFGVSTSSICERSDVAFSDSSFVTGDTISAWLWDFGDGLTSLERNPIHRFDTAGTYFVTLVAYSPTSCPGSSYQLPITVLESPRAGFTASLTCVGTATAFTDTSLLPAGAVLASVTWSFGNGDSSSSSNPILQYDTAGLYTIVQTVTTTDGCTSVDTGQVRVYASPTAAFVFDRPCNSQPVRFTNTSFSDTWSNVQSVAWNFGDPASGTSDTSTSLQPVHIFTGSSTYSVTLIAVSDKGCRDTLQRTVTPLPVSPAVFTYAPTCYGDLMQFFNPGSSLDSLYVWQFGDNQTNFLQEPAHFYALPGNYTVTLSVIAATGCISTASRNVTVSPLPVANFSAGSSCAGSNCLLTDQSTVGNGTIATRAWTVDGIGGIGNGSTTQILFPDTGNYRVRLTVTSDIGCTDTVSAVVINHPLPEASFSFDPQFGNPPLDVDFLNLSSGGATYNWHFGDGDSSIASAPSHTYADSGLFTIRMIATSAFGCSDTVLSSIYVVRPVLDIAVTGDSSYRSGDYFHIVTRLANLGTRAIDRVWLEARLENGSVIRERLTRDIPTGVNGTTTYTFSASFLLNGAEDPEYYCIKATEPNDEEDDVPSNNERCYNRTSEPVIMVYPNPTKGLLFVDLLMNNREEVDIELYDHLGRFLEHVSQSRLEPGLNRIELDIRDRSAGSYSLRIGFRDKAYTRNILLEK